MGKSSKIKIRESVLSNYKNIALSNDSDNNNNSSCCTPSNKKFNDISSVLGYSELEIENVPTGSNLGLGCGNPQAIASLQLGETVLDLGSGAGFDCFLASKTVGQNGKVIGVDMTAEMVSKARKNAEEEGYNNTDFRLGEIEYLPVADSTIDVIISNCVINLSTDKDKVFNEAFRVLKQGGRLAISDVVSSIELSDDLINDLSLYSCCISGAVSIDKLQKLLVDAGFSDIRIEPKDNSREFIKDWAPGKGIENYILSANIEAIK